ncbi:tctex1 domain-containing 4 isoform X4 [Brachionus plicatilis]|uniref:Tctex1 domain-containing 4 isoform X4 n=1 Tax=Brachionus plicatilis TaxID=10195 RepID=A0A3M7Q693_BRAPC|nr:tctex1 domain-containing 4 isoform X4 [Brachionus plicatilis]
MSDKQGAAIRRPSISFVDDAQTSKTGFERRQSIWQAARKSIYPRRMSHAMSQGSRRSSQDNTYHRIKLQNTYRTEPEENEKFKPEKLQTKLYEVLEELLKNRTYDPSKCGQLTKLVSQEIMKEARFQLNSASPRYKLISHVVITDAKGQDIRYGSRCLWDSNSDNVASVTSNQKLLTVQIIFKIQKDLCKNYCFFHCIDDQLVPFENLIRKITGPSKGLFESINEGLGDEVDFVVRGLVYLLAVTTSTGI